MLHLRESVDVTFGEESLELQHAFWSLRLPRDWLDRTRGAEQFFRKVAPVAAVDTKDPETGNVLDLLQLAGCLTAEHRDSYALHEVRDLFEPLCITWHAIYYRHPIWQQLREGRLSKNALLAWILHNYHLSRSAGVTAARCATRSSRPDIRRLFLESAREEYSHCEDHYNVRDPRLWISESEAQHYVP
jgi:hypothetical protein